MASGLSIATRLLQRARGVTEFSLVERRLRRVERRGGVGVERRFDPRVELEGVVHRDRRRGRGSAGFVAPAGDPGGIARAIEEATARAGRNLGPSWTMAPPAAPARVALEDAEVSADPGAAADALAEALEAAARRGRLRLTSFSVRVTAAETAVVTSGGFARRFGETLLAVEATAAAEGRRSVAPARLHVEARRPDDLALEEVAAEAAAALARRAEAGPAPRERCDLLLTGAALAARCRAGAPAAGFGWWAPLVAQADAERLRRGLSRYQPGQAIVGAREIRGDRLTLRSDGTLPFALLSRPFGDAGEPTRRFTLIEDGVARGLGLDARDAALLEARPNGGVRTLVVEPGAASLAELRQPENRPVIEVTELAWLEASAHGFEVSAEIAAGLVHRAGAPPHPIAGGVIRADLLDLMTRMRLCSEGGLSGCYAGPVAVRFDNVTIG